MAGYAESTYMGKSPSWKQNRSAASQQIPCILWNLKVHYHFQNSQTTIPILSQINAAYALSSSLR
jgi:hypothetical protein